MSNGSDWTGCGVDVWWPTKEIRKARVLHQPGDTGDSWLLRLPDGTEMRVMQFDRMVLIERPGTEGRG